jgi:methylated-DNA-protein-cysteine methyltransferase-like protein
VPTISTVSDVRRAPGPASGGPGPAYGDAVRARGRSGPPASLSAGLATRPVGGGTPTPYAARVLAAVDRIPPGKVMSYGDVAEFVGSGSGRAVGAVMSRHGHEVPWQRVVLSTGEPAPSAPAEALRLLRAEGVPMRGDRVDMRAARWDGSGSE